MPYTTLVSSSCASTRAPARESASTPSEPSDPIPVSTTPISGSSTASAADSIVTFAEGRTPWPRSSSITDSRRRPSRALDTSRWWSPRATAISPRPIRMPSSASRTVSSQAASSRSANRPVNASGMCWVTIPRRSASPGSAERTCSTASGPPVEEATTSVVFGSIDPPALPPGASDRPVAAPPPAVAAVGSVSAVERSALATDLTVSTSCSSRRETPIDTSPPGLAKKSTAPASSAANVSSAPSAVYADSISVGVGVSLISRSTASIPFISGISTSIVTTSGSVSATTDSASRPSSASPTTSTPPDSRMSAMSSRMNRESSTTTVRGDRALTAHPQPTVRRLESYCLVPIRRY